VKLLKGFQRIALQPSETRTVSFSVGREQLQFLDESTQQSVEPGQIELMVGSSSQKVKSILLNVSS
jgi:beta-glucosidase